MDIKDKIELGSVQKTLLLPLWGRAVESQKKKPQLFDEKAVSIIKSIPFDFSTITKNISQLSRASWIARSVFFDNEIRDFIARFPEATIVNVGCGLDTTFDRVDNGTIQWVDLDLPDAIALRRQYVKESDRQIFVAKSVFDTSWYDLIKNKKEVMLLVAGVLYYFKEEDVKKLFKDIHNFIPGTEIVFDYSSTRGVQLANKKVIKESGMDKSSYLVWGLDNIKDLEKWNNSIKVIKNMPMFKEYKMNYSLLKRIGMNISDKMKIMSLSHIKIN